MKNKILLPAVLCALILPNLSLAGPVPTFIFDESGNGHIGSTIVTSSLAMEPLSHVTTLMYNVGAALGTNPVAGDWRIDDPGQFAGISDLLRWDGSGHLFVFSGDTGGGKLADTGIQFSAHNLLLFEDSTGQINYTPVATQPAYLNGEPGYVATNLAYNFVSEGNVVVPEPATLVLAGMAALGFVGYRGGRFTRRKIA